MERNNWIQNILQSTNGIKTIAPSDDLFLKIQQRIKQESKVSPKTLWLVAASILVLTMLNITIITSKSKSNINSTVEYLEMTVNKSNQLY